MYKNPLLQTLLPRPARELPQIWLVMEECNLRDNARIVVAGCGDVRVPDMVREALDELGQEAWMAGDGTVRIFNAQYITLTLTLTCRYLEMGYVDYERVPSSSTPSPPAASARP